MQPREVLTMNMNNQIPLLHSLSDEDRELIIQMMTAPGKSVWQLARHVLVSNDPLLTLEMAVKRVEDEPSKLLLPSPFLIKEALNYAWEKSRRRIQPQVANGH